MFDILKHTVDNYKPGDEEIDLTDALEEAKNKVGMIGCVISGKSYDVGMPEKYWETMKTYAEFCNMF